MAKKAVIGETRVWNDGKKHRRTIDGWELVSEEVPATDLRKRDDKKKIYSSDILLDWRLTAEQKAAKKKIYDAGFGNFDYYSVKEDMDKIFGVKGEMNVKIGFGGTLEVDYEAKKNKGFINCQRIFEVKDGKLSVYHWRFELPEELQNKGYGKKVIQRWYDEYQKCDVARIDTFANEDVGGYAWGQYGFWCKDRANLKAVLSENFEGDADIENIVSKYYNQKDDSEGFPMYLISASTSGKKLLESGWYGYLPLEDEQSRLIFERYLENDKVTSDSLINGLTRLTKDTLETKQVFKKNADDSGSDFKDAYKTLQRKGITDKEILSTPETENVDVFHIHPTQSELKVSKLKELAKHTNWEKYPVLLKIGDEYHVFEGHHEVAIDILKNKETIKAKVYEI